VPDTLAMLSRLGVTFERTASVRDEGDLEEVLQDVAGAIGEVLGYRAVVVNVYRPAYDDMLAAAAVGSEESVRQLVGKSSPNDTWTPMFVPRFERGGAYFLPDGEFDWDSLGIDTYVPDLPVSEHPDAWLPGDALFVPLRDGRGNILGAISVDEPETGRRPSTAELEALVTISRHAALALQIAQNTANDVQHQRMLERVLEVSARLAEADDVDSVLQAVCDGIEDALGFDKVAIQQAATRGGPLRPMAATGWSIDDPAMNLGTTIDMLTPVLTEEFEVAGCYLIPGEIATARLGIDERSSSDRNGRGPHAWSRHWLLVPLRDGERWTGMIWVDDPRDRLLPTRARLQALRLFANQAVAALSASEQAVKLRHEATHDSLTGLPNRRAFDAHVGREINSGVGFALVLCDMDNLKTLNDTHGHEAGDEALQLLAAALQSQLRRSDEAYRVGGDEFAVILPAANRLDAERVVRRLRDAVAGRLLASGDAIDASFGVSVYQPGDDPERLMVRADEALYRAKRRHESAA
jgi:diguanylate cyclase (GGDEF)-like protein